MSIRIACPSCRKVYNLSESMQGKTLRCRECQSAISVPALPGQGGQEDDGRITASTRPASAAARARRNEEDEPRRRPAERRSRRDDEDDRGGRSLWPIFLGLGVVGLVLIGLIIAGVAVVTLGKGGSSQAAATSPGPKSALAGNPANPALPFPFPAGNPKGSPAPLRFNGDVYSFVEEAVRERRLTDVDIRGFTLHPTTYRDVCQQGGVLIGFQVGLESFVGNNILKSWRPIFLTNTGEQLGQWQGQAPDAPITLKARPGYVVSGLLVRTGLMVDALTVTFAKLGANGLDLNDTYNSQPVGGTGGGPSTIGGDGGLYVGVTGHLDNNGSPASIGLVAVLPK